MDVRTLTRAVLLRGGLLLAVLATLAVIINLRWFDEPLHPEIERLLQPQPVAMNDNAYPLIYGFAAADGRSPVTAGLAIVDALRERHAQGRPITLSGEEMADILGGSGLDEAWQAGFASLPCNARVRMDCTDRLLDEIEQHGDPHPRLRLLLERYERVVAAPRFAEHHEYDVATPVPPYGLLMTVGRIRLGYAYHSGMTGTFLGHAAEDMAFWRRTLRDGQSLIAKMVALAGLGNTLELLSAAMRNHDLADDELIAIERLSQPLTHQERDIGAAFLSELRVALLSGKTTVLAPSEPSWLTRLVLQERATLNEFYLTTVTPIRVRAALDARAFYTQRGYEPLPYDLRVFPPPLYNLGGKLLLKQQAQRYNVQDYLSRVHDLDGRIALVRLQAEIALSTGRSIESVVRASAHRNPYTGEAMNYDAPTRILRFDCLSGDLNDVCAVALGRDTP